MVLPSNNFFSKDSSSLFIGNKSDEHDTIFCCTDMKSWNELRLGLAGPGSNILMGDGIAQR